MLKPGNTNINATSMVDGVGVAYFVASISGEKSGNYTITKNVDNPEKYAGNQAECDADYALFEEKVRELAASMTYAAATGTGKEEK